MTYLIVKTDDISPLKSNLKKDISSLKTKNNELNLKLGRATWDSVWTGSSKDVFKEEIEVIKSNCKIVEDSLDKIYNIFDSVYKEFNNFK